MDTMEIVRLRAIGLLMDRILDDFEALAALKNHTVQEEVEECLEGFKIVTAEEPEKAREAGWIA